MAGGRWTLLPRPSLWALNAGLWGEVAPANRLFVKRPVDDPLA